jgi:hypothetical protein
VPHYFAVPNGLFHSKSYLTPFSVCITTEYYKIQISGLISEGGDLFKISVQKQICQHEYQFSSKLVQRQPAMMWTDRRTC